jgi:hypothetical protein
LARRPIATPPPHEERRKRSFEDGGGPRKKRSDRDEFRGGRVMDYDKDED